MPRELLPQRRRGDNEEFWFNGIQFSATFGYYDDGRVGEVFLSTRKAGTAVDTTARDTAVLISMLLQHGCPVATIKGALTANAKGVPEGIAGAVAAMIEERQP